MFLNYSKYAFDSSFILNLFEGFFFAIFYGMLFVSLQVLEYATLPLMLTDGVPGAVFYSLTSLHGLHVVMGLIFLGINLMSFMFIFASKNLIKVNSLNYYEDIPSFGFVFAAWYWHFVDVVWMYLFLNCYIGFFKVSPNNFQFFLIFMFMSLFAINSIEAIVSAVKGLFYEIVFIFDYLSLLCKRVYMGIYNFYDFMMDFMVVYRYLAISIIYPYVYGVMHIPLVIALVYGGYTNPYQTFVYLWSFKYHLYQVYTWMYF